jgi:sulfite reductase (ferredoxin)
MSSDTASPAAPKLSPVEGIKLASRHLRGTLAEELAQPVDHFSEESKQLLKFHGSYQQEDRDARKARSKDGVGKHYMMMIRCKIPGGKLTADQYLHLDALADQYANGTLRLTTRQSIQFHGVLKTHLKDTIAGINACLLSTLGACGDVNRNVMACPAPVRDGVHDEMQRLADAIAAHLAPRARAYHDIWLNGHRVTEDSEAEVEPIYGKVYLPRKFKTGLGLPDDNCIDIQTQDLGFLAVVKDGKLTGFNVLVGGGMGMTNGKPETFAHLGKPICFVTADEVVAAAEAVVKLYRDHGNRADRKRARIKYLVADWGVEKFREMLTPYLAPIALRLPPDVPITGIDLHLGWHEQGDGKWFYGVSVENGRIKDEGAFRLRSGLKAVVQQFQATVRLTGQQDILLCDLPASAKAGVDRVLTEHGVLPPEKLSPVQKYSMACPAIPTCGLAISESERALPGIIDQLEGELTSLGLGGETISVRMTGCPNGCARPYASDIGIVGRTGDKYTVYLGGSTLGIRLNTLFQDLVPRDKLIPMLKVVLQKYKAERKGSETFGDFCHRTGPAELKAALPPELVIPTKGGH